MVFLAYLSVFLSSSFCLPLCLVRLEDCGSVLNWSSVCLSSRILFTLSSKIVPSRESFNPCPKPRIIGLNSLIFPVRFYHTLLLFFSKNSCPVSRGKLGSLAVRWDVCLTKCVFLPNLIGKKMVVCRKIAVISFYLSTIL